MSQLLTRQSYGGIPVGYQVRKQLAHTYIYRVRRDKQDRYGYVVPSSINNPEGAAARSAMATAVSNWQNIVTPAEKADWKRRALEKGRVSGYALYIGEYIRYNA